jgi:hypothetical protein
LRISTAGWTASISDFDPRTTPTLGISIPHKQEILIVNIFEILPESILNDRRD